MKQKKGSAPKIDENVNSPARTLPHCRPFEELKKFGLPKSDLSTTTDELISMKTKIHPEGLIPAKKEFGYDRIIERLESNKDSFHPVNKELMIKFIRDARLGKTILSRQKKRVGDKRLLKYVQDLKKLDQYVNKPFSDVNEEDIEKFILDLEEGILKTSKGKPYAPDTQSVIKKVIKKFYKWLEGDNENYPKKVRWIDTSVEIPEYTALRKEEIDKLIACMVSTTPEKIIRNRAIVMFLFDSGVRAEELLNVRLKHLNFSKDNYNVRIEFSKTKKRTITLPFCKEFLNQWLDIHPLRTEPLAQLFPINYNQLHKIIRRAGKMIGVKLYPHALRHSSATYWCQHLTPYELCYRMGWSMSSRMPQRYIDREGLYQEKASKIVKATNLERLENENAQLNRRLSQMEDQISRLFNEDIEEARKIISLIKAKEEL